MLCPHCNKDVKVTETNNLGPSLSYYKLKCGHSVAKGKVKIDKDKLDAPSKDGKTLYKFQKGAVEFVRDGNKRVLIRAEPGLGKTPLSIKACIAVVEMMPVIVLCRPRHKTQWLKEIYRWCGDVAVIMNKPTDKFIPGFNWYIMSQDIIKKIDESELEKWPVNTVIIDECQHIKNLESQRTQSIRKIAKVKPNVIALSATPIKNRFDEYYAVCNILNPDKFPTYNGFVEEWCEFEQSRSGYAKVRGCKYPEEWQEFTKDMILTIKADEAGIEFPKVRRAFQYYDLADEVREAYNKKLKEFEEYFENTTDTGFKLSQNLLAYFAAMRQLTAVSKVKPTQEFIEDFLLSTERKYVNFLHHHLAADMLIAGLNEVLRDGGYGPCLYYSGGMTDRQADEVKRKFIEDPNHRVMIASTLSAGEGLDGLQKVCSDIGIMERQWNPANEEQVEGRIARIGQTGNSLLATYFIALGTIDEWLTELVEKKREMLKTADGQKAEYNENSIILELAEMIMTKRGGKKWA